MAGLTAPNHKYCGPGNHLDVGAPTNALDAACETHDKCYDAVGPLAYLTHTASDDHLIQEIERLPPRERGPTAELARQFFLAKRMALNPWTLWPLKFLGPVGAEYANQVHQNTFGTEIGGSEDSTPYYGTPPSWISPNLPAPGPHNSGMQQYGPVPNFGWNPSFGTYQPPSIADFGTATPTSGHPVAAQPPTRPPVTGTPKPPAILGSPISPSKPMAGGRKPKKGNRSVKAPVAQTRVLRTRTNPRQRQKKNGVFNVSHREYVGDVGGSITYLAVGYDINPGLAGTFPWLSKIAQSYDHYDIRSLKFEYVPRVATSTPGTVGFVFEPDVLDTAPETLARALSYPCTDSASPWTPVYCPIPHRLLHSIPGQKTVRETRIAGDLRIWDSGRLYIISEGQANTNTIGQLYVTYDVDLMGPQLHSHTAENYPASTMFLYAGTATGTQTFTTATPKFMLWEFDAVNNCLGLEFGASDDIITLPRGCYRFSATLSINQTTATLTDYSCRFLQDSVNAAPPYLVAETHGADIGWCDITVEREMIVAGPEVDIQLEITATFAAGVVTMPVNRCRLLITPM